MDIADRAGNPGRDPQADLLICQAETNWSPEWTIWLEVGGGCGSSRFYELFVGNRDDPQERFQLEDMLLHSEDACRRIVLSYEALPYYIQENIELKKRLAEFSLFIRDECLGSGDIESAKDMLRHFRDLYGQAMKDKKRLLKELAELKGEGDD